MGSPGCSRQCSALLSLLLLSHTASAARLSAEATVKLSEDFNVLAAIETEVNAMNTNLQELSKAIDSVPSPTDEPSPTSEPPTDEPSPTGDSSDTVEEGLPRLVFARRFLTLELETKTADNCNQYADIEATVDEAQDALKLVSTQQFSNTTLTSLKASNLKLTATTQCVSDNKITLDSAMKEQVKASITEAETEGEKASDTVDQYVNPPTPAPADDSGFRSATIALGVLFSLAVVAIAGLAIYAQRQKSGGHMS
ncbi:uncharacterized protein LOC122375023 [Amphibalanus amphitrite]|uniref:uncharacterized protein LOC122369588 n=1 Tax=Amphibalanus amphitrite TaxID=1232801 RepID=UPI001C91F67E|nr:uncharacterized protein LOC122369588 [Amphibalanus amphitrite]XP_043210098.1 uncharacterized protein LOC122375023 [Amphibalanus amphitrite]